MRFTKYFMQTRQKFNRAFIKQGWIESVFYNPEFEQEQYDGRIKRWAYSREDEKYLCLVILEDGETVHNAFFEKL